MDKTVILDCIFAVIKIVITSHMVNVIMFYLGRKSLFQSVLSTKSTVGDSMYLNTAVFVWYKNIAIASITTVFFNTCVVDILH